MLAGVVWCVFGAPHFCRVPYLETHFRSTLRRRTTDSSMADQLSIAASIAGILTLVQGSTGPAQIISDAEAVDSLLMELTLDLSVQLEVIANLRAISTWRESWSDNTLPTTPQLDDGTSGDYLDI